MSLRPLPMLAKPLPPPEKLKITPGRYVAEEKFDGQRLIVNTYHGLDCWSRTGKDSMLKKIGSTLHAQLSSLPPGIYDGELVTPGGYSSSVSDLDNVDRNIFIVFDLLATEDKNVTVSPLRVRRQILEVIMGGNSQLSHVQLSVVIPLQSRAHLTEIVEAIWEEKGEGVIVKDLECAYHPGKRTSAFYKLKEFQTAVLRVIGWEPSGGELVNRGPYAVAVLQDDDGVICRVKTLDDATCRKVEGEAAAVGPNPFLNRELRIEYQLRTPDGGYRHPRWDRWEDE